MNAEHIIARHMSKSGKNVEKFLGRIFFILFHALLNTPDIKVKPKPTTTISPVGIYSPTTLNTISSLSLPSRRVAKTLQTQHYDFYKSICDCWAVWLDGYIIFQS